MSTSQDRCGAGQRISTTVPTETVAELDRIGVEEHRTRSQTIAAALDFYLRERRRQKTREGFSALASLGRIK